MMKYVLIFLLGLLPSMSMAQSMVSEEPQEAQSLFAPFESRAQSLILESKRLEQEPPVFPDAPGPNIFSGIVQWDYQAPGASDPVWAAIEVAVDLDSGDVWGEVYGVTTRASLGSFNTLPVGIEGYITNVRADKSIDIFFKREYEDLGSPTDRTMVSLKGSARVYGGETLMMSGPIVGEIKAPGAPKRSLAGGFIAQ